MFGVTRCLPIFAHDPPAGVTIFLHVRATHHASKSAYFVVLIDRVERGVGCTMSRYLERLVLSTKTRQLWLKYTQ